MPAINKSFGLSSSLEEEVMVIKTQGIVSILGYSDGEKTKSPAAASLRRTLSADMSSQKWLSQNGFNSPLKRIASSEEFPVSSPDVEDDDRPNQLEIWNSIQQNNTETEKGQFDIWSSIVSNKKESETNNVPPPYVHPLVKRSASLLSEKSLQICTESLGSETGSDGFSSYPASETEEEQEEKESVKLEQCEEADFPAEKYSRKAAPKSFPPPLPSLSRGDGASLHMRPRRDNGRLVLEAVTVPPQNNFRAERQDGRLVLTFINNEEEETKAEEKKNNGDDVAMFKVEMDDSDSEDEDEIAEEIFQKPIPVAGAPNFHRLALMMNKSVVNMNPKWPKEFEIEEEVVNPVNSTNPIAPMTQSRRKWLKEFEIEAKMDEEVINPVKPVNSVNPIVPMTQSLPPRPPMGRVISRKPGPTGQAVGSLNAYEHYWKAKPMVPMAAALVSPLAQNTTISKNMMANEKIGNKRGNYLMPLSSKGCKEPRRSLLFWEPYCIATS